MAGPALAAAPTTDPEPPPTAASNFEARIRQANSQQVIQEVRGLLRRIRSRRAELQQQPEIARLVEEHRKASGGYQQKLKTHSDYVAAEQSHAEQSARYKALSAEVLALRAHDIHHRTEALAADTPASQRLGRVKDCVYCEEAYGKNPAGAAEVFRRQHKTYLAKAAQYRELRRAVVVWWQQERALTERLRTADAELARLAQVAEEAQAAVEKALAADPTLRQWKEESARWLKRGHELRQAVAAPTAKPAELPAK